MPEIGLYGSGVVASVGEGVPAGMAEHVGMWADREARTLPARGKHHITCRLSRASSRSEWRAIRFQSLY